MIVLDTGVVVAALDRSERRHRACRDLLESASVPLVLPSPIIPEVDYFVGTKLGPDAMTTFLTDVRHGAYRLEDLSVRDLERVNELMTTYADLHVSFVDAGVFTIAERMRASKVATLDHRHFGAMRPRHVDVLEIVP
jgi:hypothetical protein